MRKCLPAWSPRAHEKEATPMGKKRLTDEPIVRALRQAEGGETVGEMRRQVGIREQTDDPCAGPPPLLALGQNV